MTALDVSGDGQIDHNEFIAACIDHYQLLTDHTLTAIFGGPAAFLHPLRPTAASPPELVQGGPHTQAQWVSALWTCNEVTCWHTLRQRLRYQPRLPPSSE